jgi:hypothetical protein
MSRLVPIAWTLVLVSALAVGIPFGAAVCIGLIGYALIFSAVIRGALIERERANADRLDHEEAIKDCTNAVHDAELAGDTERAREASDALLEHQFWLR